MITMTANAIARAKSALEREGKNGWGIRLGVKGGGCSGMSYTIASAEKEKPGDEVFEFEGLLVYVDLKSYLYLNGSEIDYQDGLLEAGFKFRNPNVKRACACGESFGL